MVWGGKGGAAGVGDARVVCLQCLRCPRVYSVAGSGRVWWGMAAGAELLPPIRAGRRKPTEGAQAAVVLL